MASTMSCMKVTYKCEYVHAYTSYIICYYTRTQDK